MSQPALGKSSSDGALNPLANSFAGFTSSGKGEAQLTSLEESPPSWPTRSARRSQPSKSWQSAFLDFREEKPLSSSPATPWDFNGSSENDTQSRSSTTPSGSQEDSSRTSEDSNTLSQAAFGSSRSGRASRGGEGEKHSRESFESEGHAHQAQDRSGHGSGGRGLDSIKAQSGQGDSCRQSFDTSADCLSDLDQFDMDDCFWKPSTAINRSYSLQMGISQRKSYLNSLSEQQAAREAESLGFSAPSGMPLPDSNASFAARRCMSWADTTALVADSSQELGPEDSDEESDGKHDHSVRSASQHSVTARSLPRSMSGSYLSEGTAAAELFLRLNHARQTVSFAKKQAASYSKLDKAEMDPWEALGMLGELREYESALYDSPDLDPAMPLVEHAFQTAEACRLAYPEHDWLHLVGLLHSLGKLLGHPKVAVEPQWAICGEAFPVGCKFDPAIAFSHFFGANPDRRSRTFNTPSGMYRPGGGLASVYMAWSYSEYLYMLLLMNDTELPPEALFIIRYQKFLSLDVSHAYQSLMGPSDRAMLPWLARFRQLSAYRKVDLPGALKGADFKAYYTTLLQKYIPAGTLRF